jgi:beta-phosphoglucomutase family hydrolase
MIFGAIFDFDGVLVNSEKQHERAWTEVAKRLHKPMSRADFLAGFGMKNERFISEVIKWTKDPNEIKEIIELKEKLFQDIAAKEGVPLLPGVKEWLDTLHAHNIPCAIGSSSIRKNIEIVLQNSQVRDYFSVIISGENVHHGKPNPEVFLLGAEALHIEPIKCVVFEDALFGIEAAVLANMKAVAVTTTFPRDEFEKASFQPDAIVARLNELSFEQVATWFS